MGNEKAEIHAAIDGLRSLIDQQEYEWQRVAASLQLLVRQLAVMIEYCPTTDSTVGHIEGTATDIKHALRNARHELGEAEALMNALHSRLVGR